MIVVMVHALSYILAHHKGISSAINHSNLKKKRAESFTLATLVPWDHIPHHLPSQTFLIEINVTRHTTKGLDALDWRWRAVVILISIVSPEEYGVMMRTGHILLLCILGAALLSSVICKSKLTLVLYTHTHIYIYINTLLYTYLLIHYFIHI